MLPTSFGASTARFHPTPAWDIPFLISLDNADAAVMLTVQDLIIVVGCRRRRNVDILLQRSRLSIRDRPAFEGPEVDDTVEPK